MQTVTTKTNGDIISLQARGYVTPIALLET